MIRGLYTHGEALVAVIDNRLYSIDADGTRATLGTLNSSAGVVDFASNLTQLVVNDGSYLYVYSPATATFDEVGPAQNYNGGDRIAFVDQRIIFLERGTQKFGWSALGNAKVISALGFASAEGSPDRLVSMLADHRELWLFGPESVEVWVSSTDPDLPFVRQNAAYIEYGCAAVHSAQKSANSVTWLGRDKSGHAMVLSAQGYQPRRISTRAIEERFEGLDLNAARAYTYSDGGQQFYCLNVPGVDTTLVWDATYSQWHERAELENGAFEQWRPTCHAFAYGYHFFGTDDGTIYKLDPNEDTYGGDVKVRERIAPVVSAGNRKRLRFPLVEFLCDKATDAQIMLRWSDDNGATWSSWNYTTPGSVGQFARRARFWRTGSAIDRVYQVRVTDDAPFNPVSMHLEVQ
jgi:hypothetical protein